MNPLILLVDDNEEILEFLTDDLSSKYAIITAQNGQDALNMLDKEVCSL